MLSQMVRELAICFYLFVFKCLFSIFSLWPLRNKTTFVVSFGDNTQYVYEEIRRQHILTDVVFLCEQKVFPKFKDVQEATTILFEAKHIMNWLKAVFHIATSRHIFIDNYFGFLAAVTFKKEVKCIQLWHASGAMKKFGLEDESIKTRTDRARERFLQVYRKFDRVIAGSDVMTEIFMKSFNLKKENILPTGVPRTDFFYNEEAKRKAIDTLLHQHPSLRAKKIILYAPTYRDHELEHFNLVLEVEKMAHELGQDYRLILRLHPAIVHKDEYVLRYSDFVVDLSSSQYDINELLVAADYLITDYSSIPYDFSILHKPIIFFAYDLDEYKEHRGLMEGFEDNLPGPLVKDTQSIIDLIQNNRFDLSLVEYYAEKWNQYSKGCSSQNLVQYIFAEESFKAKSTGY
ncbi:CDP-glycerol glycerophosphotransferase family protein [Neobacillus sp. MER 74]|uniref:CDP-glycerol glycerophosphotransferase family protein n=1 Tax=Bacillaceae TaxID=186817 RepID=UPI0020423B1F|nr:MULTISPECIES: CDP-glycerol glycerophosphotransferase family protein [Bacillaceae]MCM3115321.1 CDP-glycerol glycerophosphotransferase family protein [Neobacillus sp. MER 74]